IDKVLLVNDNDEVTIGQPFVEGATVEGNRNEDICRTIGSFRFEALDQFVVFPFHYINF
ncbi:MAG: hypothetical protein HC852_07815, partial [Acaryochloridaceae cyanobacterium RU_4_10]|nr:hypothetical protein [Acaryochloridaceae cyanobacterium RU_4_10]